MAETNDDVIRTEYAEKLGLDLLPEERRARQQLTEQGFRIIKTSINGTGSVAVTIINKKGEYDVKRIS